MMRIKRIALLLVILLMSLSLAACSGTEDYTEDSPESHETINTEETPGEEYTYVGDYTMEIYYNERFGYSISYPDIFDAMFESDNGDGIIWETPDDSFTLTIWGSYNINESTGYSLSEEASARYYDIQSVEADETSYSIIAYDGVQATALEVEEYVYVTPDLIAGFVFSYPRELSDNFSEVKQNMKLDLISSIEPLLDADDSLELEPLLDNFEFVSDEFSTEDGIFGGRIVRYDGESNDTLLVFSDGEILAKLPLYEIDSTQLISADWLKSGLGLTFHINPSLQRYVFVDFLCDYEMTSYYGYGFTWAPDWNNLYFISPALHSSDDTDDSLMDMYGNVLYMSEGGNRLGGAIAATPDGRYIACDLLTSEQDIDLLILENYDGTSAMPVGIIKGFMGVASFSDNETLVISTVDDDESYLISDIIN